MTKIKKYPIKTPVSSDKFVGSDSENSDKTVNFSFDGVLALLNSEPIPEDFYIATLFDSSKIMYKTDIYRELDLQPHVSVTITMTNEIVRNGNDFFIVGNFTNDNSLPVFIVRLLGAKIKKNILIFDAIESGNLAAPIHGLIYHNDFLFTATRSSLTTITKINPYDFSDIRTLTLPNTSDYTGSTTDIIGYKNKLYILCTVDWFTTSKFIEISDNLLSYRNAFSIPSIAGYNTTSSSPFLIYNDELYVPFTINGNTMAIRVYDLQGNMKRERTNITINTTLSGGYYVTPHWMTIFNNKLILTTVYGKSLVRLDCLTLATEDSKALPTSITDDNSISRDGYLYLHGEPNPYDLTASVQLLKVKYNNFSDYTVVLDGLDYNNGNGSHGSINYKVQPSSLNLLAKKDNYLSKTANYTIVLSDFLNNNTLVVYVNATSANVTITLPLAAATAGYEIKVIKTDITANTVTVKGNGSQLINSANTFVLSAQFSNIKINSNGTQNYIL